MKAYEIKPDEDGWPGAFGIEASHRWGLPGISCSQCGFVGGWVGLEFPALSLPAGLEPGPYLEAWPVTPERLAELRVPLVRAWGENVPLQPGLKFGPLVGKASGKAGDVAWAGVSTMLMSASAVEQLMRMGVLSATTVPAALKWRSKAALDYFELQIVPGLRLATPYLTRWGVARPCSVCGAEPEPELPDRASRLAYAEWENEPILDAASLPAGDWDLLRIVGAEATIAASERFRSAVIGLGLTNITFREIRIEPII